MKLIDDIVLEMDEDVDKRGIEKDERTKKGQLSQAVGEAIRGSAVGEVNLIKLPRKILSEKMIMKNHRVRLECVPI